MWYTTKKVCDNCHDSFSINYTNSECPYCHYKNNDKIVGKCDNIKVNLLIDRDKMWFENYKGDQKFVFANSKSNPTIRKWKNLLNAMLNALDQIEIDDICDICDEMNSHNCTQCLIPITDKQCKKNSGLCGECREIQEGDPGK